MLSSQHERALSVRHPMWGQGRPSRKMRISIPKELRDEGPGDGGNGERALMLDLIVAIAKSLRPSELEALRERLRAIGAR